MDVHKGSEFFEHNTSSKDDLMQVMIIGQINDGHINCVASGFFFFFHSTIYNLIWSKKTKHQFYVTWGHTFREEADKEGGNSWKYI